MTRLLKLTLAYEGTRYAGWQRQKKAPTVQAMLEQVLEKILGERIRVVGAARTDSGVHAEGQVAHAAVQSRMPASTIERALNAVLPEDILVRSVRVARPGFHARYSAKGKLYRYTLWNSPVRPLFERGRVFHVPGPLNLRAMRRAASLLKGCHDFRGFHSTGRPVSSTVRTLRRICLRKRGPLIAIEVEAEGFLYHMVRRIVGLLVEVGKGKVPPETAGNDKPFIPPTTPAKGLCLVRVRYS